MRTTSPIWGAESKQSHNLTITVPNGLTCLLSIDLNIATDDYHSLDIRPIDSAPAWCVSSVWTRDALQEIL